jgi:hypothetical protein
MKKNKYDFIILYRKQEIVLIVGNAQKTYNILMILIPKTILIG